MRANAKLWVHVGTAGWAIPSAHQRSFPGNGSHLQRYARRLNAVEINSSFYRHHRAETYARWAASVPEDFRFAVKIPRVLTHEGALRLRTEALGRFAEEIQGLGSKLAVLLVQLPPSLSLQRTTARRFFKGLQKRIDVPLVCEPRHESWGSPRANELLTELGVARVAADPAPWPGASEPGGHTDLAYFRWHGQPRMYYSAYDEPRLATLRRQVDAARRSATNTWVIFDNTAHGHAIGNALSTARRSRR